MKLHQAFEIAPGDVVAFIGAGGKTSLMVSLAYELAEAGWRVLATTTVGMDAHQLALMPVTLRLRDGVDAISTALSSEKFAFLYDSISGETVRGIQPDRIPMLLDAVDSDVILIEADVSNGLPIKAPYSGEPIIPRETSLVVPVASMSALNHTLDETHVYNAQAIIERYGFGEGTRIKSAWIAQIMRDEELGLHGVPPGVRIIPFLNQTPMKGYGRGRARLVARLVLRSSRFHRVVIGSVRGAQQVCEVQRPIGAVVLAAGLSSRMGQPKVLLPWAEGRTVIEHIIDQLVKARVDHITVVTGYQARDVRALLKPLEVDVIYNKNYRAGEMLSSVKAGLSALPGHLAGALVVLGDQPRIQPKVIYQVMMAYAENDVDLVMPTYQSQSGYPVLIGQRYWNEIINLPDHASLPNHLMSKTESILQLKVDSDSILYGIDTPQDYQNERWRAGL